MDIQVRLDLIQRNLEETLTKRDLTNLIASGMALKHYIGFEISGELHLGTGLMCMSKVRDFIDAGIDCSILLADWHSWINDKLGGDHEVIKRIAVGYFKEGLKASFKCLGGDPQKLRFVLGSDLCHRNDRYWETVIEVSKNVKLARILRSLTIMGREEGPGIDFAKLIYPSMQVTDIFIQGIHLPHGGLDQRKAHVIARDVSLRLKISPLRNAEGDRMKPVAVHHHLILGLQKPPMWPVPKDSLRDVWVAMKMSKSKPKTAIFITDTPDAIREKVRRAFCPPDEVELNPILDWAKYLLLREQDSELLVKRPTRFGGDITYQSFSEVAEAYREGCLHPMDLKGAVSDKLIELLEPARAHFQQPKPRHMKEELERLVASS